MNVSPLHELEFSASVMAVPPLARRADFSLDADENAKLIRHIEAGGVRTVLYGGNANLYHVAVSEYRELLDMLAGSAGPTRRAFSRKPHTERRWCCRFPGSPHRLASKRGSRASPISRACRLRCTSRARTISTSTHSRAL